MSREEQGKKMGQIIAKAWSDEAFKQTLLTNANAALKAEGIEVPAGVTVKVLENTDQAVHFVLPAKPKAELDDGDLGAIVGGHALTCHRFSFVLVML